MVRNVEKCKKKKIDFFEKNKKFFFSKYRVLGIQNTRLEELYRLVPISQFLLKIEKSITRKISTLRQVFRVSKYSARRDLSIGTKKKIFAKNKKICNSENIDFRVGVQGVKILSSTRSFDWRDKKFLTKKFSKSPTPGSLIEIFFIAFLDRGSNSKNFFVGYFFDISNIFRNNDEKPIFRSLVDISKPNRDIEKIANKKSLGIDRTFERNDKKNSGVMIRTGPIQRRYRRFLVFGPEPQTESSVEMAKKISRGR